jgi:hypothetical protein
MPACGSEPEPSAAESGAVLALNHDKSPSCPTPRQDRAFVLPTGEMVPIPCHRNACPYCRPRNVQITAAMMGINAARSDKPPTYAVLSTTRDWVDEHTLRNGWKDMARRVRREIAPDAGYAWFREWTTGRNDGVRRTHYHSTWSGISDDAQASGVAEISNDIWKRLAGAHSEKAHGYKRIWNAGGLARYVAGLAGHHMKQGQAPPPGWSGRRFGTSRGFYAVDARELRAEAESVVRDERLVHRLTREIFDQSGIDHLPEEIVDELLTVQLEEARQRPRPTVVRTPRGWSWN